MFTPDTNVPCPCWQNLLSTELCKSCLAHLQKSLFPRTLFFDLGPRLPVRAMGRYDAMMKNFIYHCKSAPYNGLMPAQKNVLKALCAFWAAELRPLEVDAVMPVPAHPLRGILQSDLAWFLARYLSRQLGCGEPISLLKRKVFVNQRLYRPQKSLNRVKRQAHIRNQYYIPQSARLPQRLLLVDDVCTTGSTLLLCRELLEKAGHRVQSAVVLAKVL